MKKKFKLLQFLAFSRTQKTKTEVFCNQPYFIVQFKITDFINFIKIKNQSQREQLIQFFNKLQTLKLFLNIVTNNEFQSFVIFSIVKAKKEFGYKTIVKIAMLQLSYISVTICIAEPTVSGFGSMNAPAIVNPPAIQCAANLMGHNNR